MSEIEVDNVMNPVADNTPENNNENKSIENNNENNSNENIIIEKKPINKLTKQERDIIVNNAKNGIDNKYYDVKLFKNGSTRIVLKKNNKKNDCNSNEVEDKISTKSYLSNDQFLMEHIIKLNSKVEHLRNKQKKLKRKYHKMKHDIYEETDDSEIISENIGHEAFKNEVNTNETNDTQTEVPQTEIAHTPENNINNENVYYKQPRGWRRYVKGSVML